MKEFKDYFSKSEIVLWSSSVMVIIISFCVFDRINYMTLCASLHRGLCGHHEPCRIPHKPCSIGVLCRAYKGGNPYQSSFTADTGTYRLCADKVVCKRVYEVERILLN